MQTPQSPAVVDPSTLVGKVMCGYQGWFDTPTDGAGRGWVHWPTAPDRANIDLWPDMSEYAPDLHYPSSFTNADGSIATLYSPQDAGTVDLHFQWMREYGIDGVFLQRFMSDISNPAGKAACDKVLDNVRGSAQRYGRAYGLMYDLTSQKSGSADAVITDWKQMADKIDPKHDERYIRYNGKPLITFWGVGFEDGGREPLLDDALRIIDFVHNDPVYGGYSVMIGVPPEWREIDTPEIPHEKMLDIARAADIVTPWSVGRARNLEDVANNAAQRWKPDIAWCNANHVGYLPVVYPGFSWHNLNRGTSPLDMIPRLGGRFLWSQYAAAKSAGATMVYQAMFDEVNEGTAIYKCTDTPPVGQGAVRFLTNEGLPSDFYLRLVGEATRLISGQITAGDESLIGKYPSASPTSK